MPTVPPPSHEEIIQTKVAYSDEKLQLLKITNTQDGISKDTYQVIIVPGVALATAIIGINPNEQADTQNKAPEGAAKLSASTIPRGRG